MVYSGGVRSFIQAAAVCALALSALPSIQAKGATTPAPTSNQVTCGISDGDKQVGIQAINDSSCANGGLGCYNKHCRYCKVLDTPKSSHLDTCLSHGVAFTTTSTVTVSRGPCEVSSGDVAAGIAAVTDSGCLYSGLGCFNDHCRFCKVVETPQSAGFMACSSLDSSYSPVATQAPVTAAPTIPPTSPPTIPPTAAPTVPATAAPTVQATITSPPTAPATDVPVTEAPKAPTTEAPATETPTVPPTDAPGTEAPSSETPTTAAPASQSMCSIVPSAGDLDVGVTIVTDLLCASGGLGCLSDVCRFCKLKTTPQSDSYMDCALVNGTPTATQIPATTEAPSVTSAVAETEAPVTTTTGGSDTEAPMSTTAAPGDTEAPVVSTDAPVATTDVPVSTTETPVSTEKPAATDAPVATVETPIATTAAPVETTAPDAPTEAPTPTDAPTEAPISSDAPTEAPVSADAPVATTEAPVISTDAPVSTETPAPATTCSLVASAEDAGLGISVGTDPSCSLGGVGCIDEICRFCKITTSLQSAPFIDCALLENGSVNSEAPALDDTIPPSEAPTETPDATDPPTAKPETPDAPTEAPITATDAPDTTTEAPATVTDTDAPDAATEAPTATETPTEPPVVPTDAPVPEQQTCGIVAAAGDIAVGVYIATDLTCSTGGVGCINDLCRFCKLKTTPQSEAFVDCSSLDGFTSDSAAPVDTMTAPPVNVPGTCDLVASSGDALVGISIVTDSACAAGGVGCINDVCRFCKVITSVQSAAFIDCTTVDGYTPATETPAATTITDATTSAPISDSTCTRVASGGDISVGVDIFTDTTCRAGGVGCIDDVCRFCQVTATPQSAAFVNCTSLSGYTPRVEAPVGNSITIAALATASTDAPVVQPACGLVVSAGDAAVGISITGDATCASGGVGCIDNVCRFCKVTTTVQSAAFVDCTSIAGFTLATDAPIDTTMPPTVSTTVAPVASTPGGTCSLVVSEGDAAVGIDIFADTSCQFGGVGCIDSVCRFCKVKTTDQSATFVDCPVVITTTAPAATTPPSLSITLEPTTTDVDTTPTDSSVSTETPVTTDASTTETPVDVATDAPASPTELPSADTATPATETPSSVSSDVSDTLTDAASVTTDATTDAPIAAPTDSGSGNNYAPTDAPVGDTAPPTVVDTSDTLTEAPVVTTEPPTKAPLPTVDDIDDNWEGSDSTYSDSDSTYYDSEESEGGS